MEREVFNNCTGLNKDEARMDNLFCVYSKGLYEDKIRINALFRLTSSGCRTVFETWQASFLERIRMRTSKEDGRGQDQFLIPEKWNRDGQRIINIRIMEEEVILFLRRLSSFFFISFSLFSSFVRCFFFSPSFVLRPRRVPDPASHTEVVIPRAAAGSVFGRGAGVASRW